jgi:hypothetical protein
MPRKKVLQLSGATARFQEEREQSGIFDGPLNVDTSLLPNTSQCRVGSRSEREVVAIDDHLQDQVVWSAEFACVWHAILS